MLHIFLDLSFDLLLKNLIILIFVVLLCLVIFCLVAIELRRRLILFEAVLAKMYVRVIDVDFGFFLLHVSLLCFF